MLCLPREIAKQRFKNKPISLGFTLLVLAKRRFTSLWLVYPPLEDSDPLDPGNFTLLFYRGDIFLRRSRRAFNSYPAYLTIIKSLHSHDARAHGRLWFPYLRVCHPHGLVLNPIRCDLAYAIVWIVRTAEDICQVIKPD